MIRLVLDLGSGSGSGSAPAARFEAQSGGCRPVGRPRSLGYDEEECIATPFEPFPTAVGHTLDFIFSRLAQHGLFASHKSLALHTSQLTGHTYTQASSSALPNFSPVDYSKFFLAG